MIIKYQNKIKICMSIFIRIKFNLFIWYKHILKIYIKLRVTYLKIYFTIRYLNKTNLFFNKLYYSKFYMLIILITNINL